MPWDPLLIELAALTLGAGYLYWKHRQRMRHWRPSEAPGEWTGHGIEASRLKPRVEQVRQDCLAARQVIRGLCFHRHLLGFARLAVLQLGFFQHREPGEHAHAQGS